MDGPTQDVYTLAEMRARKTAVGTCPLCQQCARPRQLYASEVMRVVRCAACGLMYQDPRLAETEWGDTYHLLPEYQAYSDASLRAAKLSLFGERIRRLREDCRLPASGTFLDIGASYGVMMQCVATELSGWECYGVEPSATARGAARQAGLSVVPDLAALPQSLKFDWINLDNTLEHVEDPLAFLSELRNRLTPSGFLYVEVPNESFFRLRFRINDAVRGEKKAPTLPGHLTLFTRSTLGAMLRRAGYIPRIWTESVAMPNRMSGVCNQDEAKFRTVLAVLRVTKADQILGLSYFICAIARTPEGAA